MKKSSTKLSLNQQTIRTLASSDLALAAGGWIRPPITWSCPQPIALSEACTKVE